MITEKEREIRNKIHVLAEKCGLNCESHQIKNTDIFIYTFYLNKQPLRTVSNTDHALYYIFGYAEGKGFTDVTENFLEKSA